MGSPGGISETEYPDYTDTIAPDNEARCDLRF
mgnify:CR=1 FL=1